jgi:hypothetical protein
MYNLNNIKKTNQMPSKIKKEPSYEIDISEMIITTWNNKWKVFFVILITVIVSIYNTKDDWEPKNNKIIYQGKAKIIPISIFNDNDYRAYNSYLTSIEEKSIGIYNLNINKKDFDNILVINKNIEKYNIFKDSSLSKIDRMFLYELFLEKLNSNDLYIKAIKKFDLLKKENFQNIADYENAILKLSSLIKKPTLDFNEQGTAKKMVSFIEFRASDDNILVWEKILYFVQNSANYEINNYLKKDFEILVSNEKRLRQYKIEDIDFDIKNNPQNEKIKNDLLKLRKKIDKNKDIERLINIFKNTPIMMSENFKAALIKIPSTEYSVIKKTTYTSPYKIVFLSAFLGLFLGIIFVLISNIIQKNRT